MGKRYDFLNVFSDICSWAGMRAARKKLDFKALLPDALSGCTLCSKERLRHILLNICLYVISHTAGGGISLAVKKVTAEEKVYLRFIFAADGLEFEKAEKNRLFSFIDMEENNSFELAIASMLAVKEEGKLEVCFDGMICLYLPFSSAAVCRDVEQDSGFLSDDIKILLVDDKEINLLLMRENIKQLGVWADIVDSGRGCLNKLASGERYDIIFMDYMMPELDGVETAQRIRSLNCPFVKNVPIIAITAEEEEQHEQLIAAGMNDCLFKPISRRQIAVMLEKWLPADKGAGVRSRELGLAWRDFNALRDFLCLDSRKGLFNSGGCVEDYIIFLKNVLFYAPKLVFYLRCLAKGDFMPLLYVIEDCKAVFTRLAAPGLVKKTDELRRCILVGDLSRIAGKVDGFCGMLDDFIHILAERMAFEREEQINPE